MVNLDHAVAVVVVVFRRGLAGRSGPEVLLGDAPAEGVIGVPDECVARAVLDGDELVPGVVDVLVRAVGGQVAGVVMRDGRGKKIERSRPSTMCVMRALVASWCRA